MKNKLPKFHFAEKKGWINDPNGCVFYQGEYHLFYQYNPYDTVWGPMHWGHAKTKDFINWEYLPIALKPDEEYENKEGCFSGSAVIKDGKLNLLYTATQNIGNSTEQTQCLAVESGFEFKKSKLNPLVKRDIKTMSEDFRDPKIIEHNNLYYMVLGSSTDGARNNGDGQVLLYESTNLESWIYKGVLFKSSGKFGTMFECPDLIKIDDKWVLIFSPMFYGENKSTYIIGNCDLPSCKFEAEYSSEIDFGTDYYAPQSFYGADKPIIIAWQNSWEWMPWFENFGCSEIFSGSMSMVRELSIVDNRLISKPLKSYDKFFKLIASKIHNQDIDGIGIAKVSSTDLKIGDVIELCFKDEKIVLNFKANEIEVDRSNLKEYYSNKKAGPYSMKKINSMDLYIDENSIELFINDGEYSMSCLMFAQSDLTNIKTNRQINLDLYQYGMEEEC